MPRVPEEIERLLVRSLDASLSADEQLALDREVLRNPEARRMLDEYRQIDGLSASLLREHLAGGLVAGLDLAAGPVRPTRAAPPRYSRWWWMMPAAAAAGLALMATVQQQIRVSSGGPALVVDGGSTAPERDAGVDRKSYGLGGSRVQQASGGARSISDKAVHQDVYFVVGDDGKIYLLQRDRTREFTRPGPGRRVQPGGGL